MDGLIDRTARADREERPEQKVMSVLSVSPFNIPAVLTIAGSDSGGGAGIQADLKVFQAQGCFGTAAVTCVTAQNPDEVRAVEAISASMVAAQVRAVCDSFPVAAVKTGMLFSAEIIAAVAEVAEQCGIRNLIVDPVMVSTSEKRLLREDAVEALQTLLLPKALVITPNLPEAEVLCGHSITTEAELEAAAEEIGQKFGTACALKGGHLGEAGSAKSEARSGGYAGESFNRENHESSRKISGSVVDVLYSDGTLHVFRVPRVDIAETHGTGCTFAAALAAGIAKGSGISDAVRDAQLYVAGALASAVMVGRHTPLGVPNLLRKK